VVVALSKKGGGTEVAGSLHFRQVDYWADGRGRKSKFISADEKGGLTVGMAVEMVYRFLKEVGGSDTCLAFVKGTITCDRMAAEWGTEKESDILVTNDPPFTAEEFTAFLKLVRERLTRDP